MIDFRGKTGEFRIALTAMVVSLVVLILQLPDSCGDQGLISAYWLYAVSLFTFTFGFVWLLVIFFEGRGSDRALATVYAVSCNFAIGFVGWGLSEWFLGNGTPDRIAMHNSYYWLPFWILGVLLGTDFYNLCGGD